MESSITSETLVAINDLY